MGIIYQVKIRCLKVNDLNKVDLNVLSEEEDDGVYKKKLKAYYEASKANLDTVLALYDHDPGCKRDYTMTNIYIPYGTNVLAFGNNACDRYGPNRYYYVKFYNADGKLFKNQEVRATSERNNFMLLVPPTTLYIDYEIGDNAVHNFRLGPKCTLCHLSDTDSSSNSDSDSSSMFYDYNYK